MARFYCLTSSVEKKIKMVSLGGIINIGEEVSSTCTVFSSLLGIKPKGSSERLSSGDHQRGRYIEAIANANRLRSVTKI